MIIITITTIIIILITVINILFFCGDQKYFWRSKYV